MRPTFLLVEGKAALTFAWMACTLPAAPIPAQELAQATLFPPKRRPRSHFALSPTCSDRTRTAPLKNLDSSRGVGNYRTASAGVFTLNTHSRSRIWTVLDGESYAAALRRRHWEYTAPHPYSRIWTVLREAAGLTVATAHTDGL